MALSVRTYPVVHLTTFSMASTIGVRRESLIGIVLQAFCLLSDVGDAIRKG